MKVLFTGATGVMGRAGVSALVGAGHEVIGVARREPDAEWLDRIEARPVTVDLFDPVPVAEAMSGVDTVVHYATAIPRQAEMSKRDSWALNDRLRDTATGLLVDAALAAGAERFIQESITFVYRDGGSEWLDETAPVSPAWEVLESALAAERHVERFRAGGGTGVVLRFSRLYGPGNASSELLTSVRGRQLPVIGSGKNYVSSIHVDDATTALVAALTVPDGTYNVTDDEPVTSAEYATVLAGLVGAAAPRHVPSWMARLAAGKAVDLLTLSQRVSNQRFANATGWRPGYPSMREGFAAVVAGS